jgi:uncharacterized protein YegL
MEDLSFESKRPVIFVVNGAKEALSIINDSFKSFFNDVSNDTRLFNQLDIAVVCAVTGKVVRDFSTCELNNNAPSLTFDSKTDNLSVLKNAIELLEERKKFYKSYCIPYYTPCIIHLSGCEIIADSSNINFIKTLINDAEDSKKFNYIGLNVFENDSIMNNLEAIKGKKSMVYKLKDIDSLKNFFEWFSNEIIQESKDMDIINLTPDKDIFKLTVK